MSSSSSPSLSSLPPLEKLNERFHALINVVQKQQDESPTDLLFQIKGIHRKVSAELEESSHNLKKRLEQQERQTQQLAALRYEKDHLLQKIQACRSFATPHLLELAQEEEEEETDKKKSQQEVLHDFLQADLQDTSKRQEIIDRLHQEINVRANLESELRQKREKLTQLQAELKTKRTFLESLPDHLSAMERASLPLQKFMKQSSSSNNILISSDRAKRLQAAKTLPPPLYTVFYQLQQYMDLQTAGANEDETARMSVSVLSNDANKQVLLQLPVPDVVGGSVASHKHVTIHFHCCLENTSVPLVTAVASGCGTSLNQGILLEKLFPNDTPVSNTATTVGRPYHWCNSLAGLPYVQPDPQTSTTTTRVILRELKRRIRANATLKHVLHCLQRKHVPSVPQHEDSMLPLNCTLDSFTQVEENDGRKRKYAVTLRSRQQQSITVHVEVHLVRYPAVPPVWSMCNVNNEPNPLYDDRLAALERLVNVEMLDRMMQSDDQQEGCYDWILVLQLRQIMQTWSSWQDGADAKDSSSRKRKGRDRVDVSTESSSGKRLREL